MNDDTPHSSQNRRAFLKGAALATGAALLSSRGVKAAPSEETTTTKPILPSEWRNKQEGMAYRRLGNTGLMVSEIVQGGSGPMTPETYKRFDYAIERGLNYFDTAYRYSRGRSEEGIGLLTSRPGIRDKVFISTKMSPYLTKVDSLCLEIFRGLPGEKQSVLRKKADELLEESGVTRPGYFYQYFPAQDRDAQRGYLCHAIKIEYGYQQKWRSILEQTARESIEASLRRLTTDHVDILHCPHGARVPLELEDEIIIESFAKFKKEGKARFSSLSSHTDAPNVLTKAAELGHYDAAMVAYNVASQGIMEKPIRDAKQSGMGIIAMKAAAGVYTKYDSIGPIPEWRIQKLDVAIPEKMKIQPKAYLWALQNPNLSAVISEMFDHQMMDENFAIVGRKVEFGAV